MFEHFTTPAAVFGHKLAAALTMEQDSLEMLGEMEIAAMRSDLKSLLNGHAHETRQQIANLEQCFALVGQKANPVPSPTTKGLAKEAKSFVAKTENTLVDGVVLTSALEIGHYEVGVYEALIILAKAQGAADVAELLDQNLTQEQAAIEKIRAAAQTIARADAADVVDPGAGAQDTAPAAPILPPRI